MNVRALQPLVLAAAARGGAAAGRSRRRGRRSRRRPGRRCRGRRRASTRRSIRRPGAPATPAHLRPLSVTARWRSIRRDEVVLQDENLFQIQVFGRTTTTPATAAFSEPTRAIRGENTHLELNCALYIDPKTGNIYSLNNDTERSMTVWDRNAWGRRADLEAADADGVLRSGGGRGGGAADHRAARTGGGGVSEDGTDNDPPSWVIWGDNRRSWLTPRHRHRYQAEAASSPTSAITSRRARCVRARIRCSPP